MKTRINYFLSTLSIYLHSYRQLFYLFSHKNAFLTSKSYFEEIGERKSTWVILWEQLLNILRYGYLNDFYFLYGFDRKGFRNQKEYVDYALFRRKREVLNHQVENNHIVVLRDKLLFGLSAECYCIPTPHNIGYLANGKFINLDSKLEKPFEGLLELPDGEYFVKAYNGECADGVYKIEIKVGGLLVEGKETSLADFQKKLGENGYLVQKKIDAQHPVISRIYPNSINTIRLVSVYDRKNKRAKAFTAVLRVGANGNNVDNWAVGGLSIGIDIETGMLRKYGFYKPYFGRKADKHPNTGVIFEGIKVPFWKQLLEKAILFHEKLRDIHSIGWDIGITQDGPVFIEGNDNWEISFLQACNGGLKKEYKELFIR